MEDNKKKGKADRDRVAGGQTHEVDYAAKSMGVPAKAVKSAVKSAGNMRKNVRKAAKKS